MNIRIAILVGTGTISLLIKIRWRILMSRITLVVATVAVLVLATAAARAESRGAQIFHQKCTMCHVVAGKGGAIGPDLSKVAARMNAGDIKAKMENPKKRDPSSAMPSFRTLPKAEMDAVLVYVNTLR